jgi:hypothetical protein
MSDAIAALRKQIQAAKHGSPDSLLALRNVIRAWTNQGYPNEVILLAEALCEVRDVSARQEAQRN